MINRRLERKPKTAKRWQKKPGGREEVWMKESEVGEDISLSPTLSSLIFFSPVGQISVEGKEKKILFRMGMKKYGKNGRKINNKKVNDKNKSDNK